MARCAMRRSSKTVEQGPPALHPPYCDFAYVMDGLVLTQLQNGGRSPAESKRLHAIATGDRKLFPTILHKMLDQTSCSSLESVVSWLPQGRAFKVHDKKRFVQEVMPQHFGNQTKYESFLRQLNNYGFMQLMGDSTATTQGSYYHVFCLRGRPVLCRLIACPIVAKNRVRRLFDTNSEPKFDRMSPLPMLFDSKSLGNYAALPAVDDPLGVMASQAARDIVTVQYAKGPRSNLSTGIGPDCVGPPPAIWLPRNLCAIAPRTQPTASFPKVSQKFPAIRISSLRNRIDASSALRPTHPWNGDDLQMTSPHAPSLLQRNQACLSRSAQFSNSFIDRACILDITERRRVDNVAHDKARTNSNLYSARENDRTSLDLQHRRINLHNSGNAKSGASLDLSHDCGSSMDSGGVKDPYELE